MNCLEVTSWLGTESTVALKLNVHCNKLETYMLLCEMLSNYCNAIINIDMLVMQLLCNVIRIYPLRH